MKKKSGGRSSRRPPSSSSSWRTMSVWLITSKRCAKIGKINCVGKLF